MINQLLLICFTVTIYEFFKIINLKENVISNLKIYRKIVKLFTLKKASDRNKEKVLLSYSSKLFLISLKIVSALIFILFLLYIFTLLSNSLLDFIISIWGIIEITFICIIYNLLRGKINEKL